MTVERRLILILFVILATLLWVHHSDKAASDVSRRNNLSVPTKETHRPKTGNKTAARKSQRHSTTVITELVKSGITQEAFKLGQATQSVSISYEVFSKFTPDDVNYLNECYRSRTNISDRATLTTVLGKIGNEQTVSLFIHCLTAESAGKIFNKDDYLFGEDPETVLFNTTAALGVLSSRFDSAFQFLMRGVHPEFWDSNIQWRSEKGRDTVGMMTAITIDGLGSSGRDEARAILNELVKNPPTRWPPENPRGRTFTGSIISGAFRLDFVQEHGIEAYRAGLCPSFLESYQQWKASEKAKPWLQAK